jgi:hypothetical protein
MPQYNESVGYVSDECEVTVEVEEGVVQRTSVNAV